MENCFSENPRFSRGFQFCEHLEMVFLLFIGEHPYVPVFLNFFLIVRKKLQKRSKKPAVLSLIDFESSLSRSPIGYHPPQRTRL